MLHIQMAPSIEILHWSMQFQFALSRLVLDLQDVMIVALIRFQIMVAQIVRVIALVVATIHAKDYAVFQDVGLHAEAHVMKSV